MNIEAGQWWETRGGERAHIRYVTHEDMKYPVFAVYRAKGGCLYSESLSKNGRYWGAGSASTNRSDLVKHLPDCTGWDWEPPTPVDLGDGWRLLEDHEVVRGDDEREYTTTDVADWLWEPVKETLGNAFIGETLAVCKEERHDLVVRRRIQPDVPADWKLIGGVPGGMLYFKPTEVQT